MKNPTLELFSQLLRSYPYGVSPQVFEDAQVAYERLQDGHASDNEVETIMIAFGKQVWPYTQAEMVLYKQYGKQQEEEFFLNVLPEELQEKWKSFIEKGGSVHNYRAGQEFEDAFTPEENLIIEDAFMSAGDHGKSYVRNIIAEEKGEDYDALVDNYMRERDSILAVLDQIVLLKETGDKWDAEIDEYVRFVKSGFANVEERPTLEKVVKKKEWFEDQINIGNK